MMNTADAFTPLPYVNRTEFYRELRQELTAMRTGYWLTDLANVSAALMAHLPELNWAGFYLMVDDQLRLGPFQGLPACTTIALGKGVCGTAALTRATQRVADVHAFPGHIACDARSRSELVIPLVLTDRVLGVLDLDSPRLDRFDQRDQNELEEIVRDLMQNTDFTAAPLK